MPSPFPGMDPYIESSGMCGDFHSSMLAAMRAELNRLLPPGYAASTDPFVWTHEARPGSRARPIEPDVYVHKAEKKKGKKGTTATIEAPATIVLPRLERRKRKFLKVEDVRTKRVV